MSIIVTKQEWTKQAQYPSSPPIIYPQNASLPMDKTLNNYTDYEFMSGNVKSFVNPAVPVSSIPVTSPGVIEPPTLTMLRENVYPDGFPKNQLAYTDYQYLVDAQKRASVADNAAKTIINNTTRGLDRQNPSNVIRGSEYPDAERVPSSRGSNFITPVVSGSVSESGAPFSGLYRVGAAAANIGAAVFNGLRAAAVPDSPIPGTSTVPSVSSSGTMSPIMVSSVGRIPSDAPSRRSSMGSILADASSRRSSMGSVSSAPSPVMTPPAAPVPSGRPRRGAAAAAREATQRQLGGSSAVLAGPPEASGRPRRGAAAAAREAAQRQLTDDSEAFVNQL